MRGIGRVQPGGGATRAGGASRAAGGFSLGGGGGAVSAGVAGAPAVAALGLGLLAAQEEAGAQARDAAAWQRATGLLDALQDLQRDLLDGTVDPERLARLAELQSGEEGADPALREVVQEIVLRAQVELIRRQRAGV